MGKTQKKQKTSRKPTKNNIWRLFGKALLTKSKKPRENQKTKKPKLFRECLVWGSCLFFLVLPRFFCFFLVLTLKKLKKLKVFLAFWIKWWLKNCEKPKKLKVFFGFWVFVALVSFWLRNEKPKKTLSFFGFSHFFNHHFIQKAKKTLSFLVFSRSRPKKKTKKPRQNQKKPNMSLRPNILWKVLVFWFFGFLEVLVILYFLRFNPNQENSKYKVGQLRS